MSTQQFLQRIKQNWQPGVTVALVSIPLSLSLAIASQASPISGIITAVWAGLFAAIFGSSNYNIVGPTGALSGFLATYAIMHGACNLPMLGLVTGVFIVLAYLFRLDRIIAHIPSSTIHGFTLGVACIIALNQLHFALGLYHLPKHEKFIHNVLEVFKHLPHGSITILFIFALLLGLMFLLLVKKPQWPGVLIVSPISLLLGYASTVGWIPVKLHLIGHQFGQLPTAIRQPVSWCLNSHLVFTAAVVASIAILETLISAKIADRMTGTRHDQHQEVLGLGLANIASGLFGGFPATAALARTALNVRTGATHRVAQAISSITIGCIALLCMPIFSYLPLSSVAAILVFVAIRMIEHEHFLYLFAHDRKNFWLSLFVALVCIVEDPIIGIFVGTSLSYLLKFTHEKKR